MPHEIVRHTDVDSKIATHRGDASAHHTKTTDASEIVTGRFGMPRMPDGPDGQVLTGRGLGVDPSYTDPVVVVPANSVNVMVESMMYG